MQPKPPASTSATATMAAAAAALAAASEHQPELSRKPSSLLSFFSSGHQSCSAWRPLRWCFSLLACCRHPIATIVSQQLQCLYQQKYHQVITILSLSHVVKARLDVFMELRRLPVRLRSKQVPLLSYNSYEYV